MKSITIHGLDDDLARELEARAKAEKLSLNRTVKKLLSEATGLRPRDPSSKPNPFEEFAGVWTVEEAAEFDKTLEEQRQIDPEQWT